MKLRLLLIFTLFTYFSQAQVIWTNPITGTNPGQVSPYITGQTVNPNITVGGIARSSGIQGNDGNDRYNANNWNTSPAIDLNDYFQFSITPNTGYQIDFESFVYTGQASGTGPANFFFRSNVDNYTTNIGSVNASGTTVILSAAAYQDRTVTTTFRFYGSRSGGNTGTYSINDFTFNANVSPNCASVVITNVTPASGPIGTEVTITAASGLLGATATFSGIAATVVSSSATALVVNIPAGSTTGSLIVSNATACPSNPRPYSIIKDDKTNCQGTGRFTDVIISEIYDAQAGSSGLIELYNPTTSPINLATNDYRLARFADAGPSVVVKPLTGTIPALSTYLVDSDGTLTPCTNFVGSETLGVGYNENDRIELRKFGTTVIDVVITPNEVGYTIKRLTTVVGPSSTFNAADWVFLSTEDCSDLKNFAAIPILAPTVTGQPSATISCTTKNIVLSATGTEGFTGGNPLAYQWFMAVPGGAIWTEVANGTTYSGATTPTLNITGIETLYNYQYYCQIRENTDTCFSASNAYVIKDIPSATWNGTWTPSAPTNTMKAVIGASYNTTTSGSIDACKCQINSGVTVTVTDAHYLDVVMGINNGGTIIRASGGSIGQSNDTGANTGTGINTLNRTTSSYDRFDSTYFSAPVSNTTIGLPFAGWRINDSYSFNPANWSDLNNDNFDDNGDAWVRLTAATPMIPGVGYAVMAPTTGTFPTTANVQFTGTLNNGEIKVPLLLSGNAADANDDYNFVGNPYPSKLDVVKFIDANILPANNRISGTVYLWTHKRPVAATVGPYQYNFSVADYAMRTKLAGTSSGMGSPAPTQYLATEQGFFVEAVNAGDLIFNNSMRVHETTDNFYKSQAGPESMSRIWLNMESSLGFMSQLAVGYADNSSLDVDPGYDGLMFPAGNVLAFYSTIGTDAYKIQARGNYDADDVIPLGYTYDATISGTFDIRMDEADGLFDAGNAAPVFLEDLDLHIIHDLRQGAYSFSTAPGTFNNRFVLRFINTALGNTNFDALQKQVVVAQKAQKVSIRSAVQPLQEIVVYDLLGRTIYTSEKLNQNEFSTSDIAKAQQGLILKIRLQDGSTVTKKIFF